MDNMKHRRLQELDRSNFEIVKDEPDIRGWDVKNNSGIKIGEVEELIIDAQKKKVLYMVVNLDDNQLKLSHRKILLPIGLAELDRQNDDVFVPTVSVDQLIKLPDYNKDHVDADAERAVCFTLGRQMPLTSVATSTPSTTKAGQDAKKERDEKDEMDPDFYGHEYYNLDNLYKNRIHEAASLNAKNESEYERSLRLWERTSEGGIIHDERDGQITTHHLPGRDNEIDEETRREIIKNRRNNYEQKRYSETHP